MEPDDEEADVSGREEMNESFGWEGSVVVVNSGESDGSDVDENSVNSGGYTCQALLHESQR